jgi:hypothetical protein
MNEITEAQFYTSKNKNQMFKSFSFTKVATFAVIIFCTTLILANIFVGEKANAKALELANWKVEEVTSEAQAQQWLARKTQATKEILRLNSELAKEAQSKGLTQATLS